MSPTRANVRYRRIWGTGSAIERRNYWAELSIWSKRRLGELIAEGQENGTIRREGPPSKQCLHDANIIAADSIAPGHTRSRAKQVAAIPEEKIEALLQDDPKVLALWREEMKLPMDPSRLPRLRPCIPSE